MLGSEFVSLLWRLTKWAKTVYSPLRTQGVAHRMYLRGDRCVFAIPLDSLFDHAPYEVIGMNEVS